MQTVVADDPRDDAQVALIRQHLSEEAARFERGDFDDPAHIHGHDMPGLAALREHGGRLTVDYTPVPEGGRITYTTDDSALRDALHLWFEAQLSDHGAHAER